MKQIRQGVFETNSSSVHSLSVLKRDSYMSSPYPLKGFFGEYGWGHDRLINPIDKLSYVLVALSYFVGVNEVKKTQDEAVNLFITNKYFIWLNEAVKKYTGSEIVFDWEEVYTSQWYPFGYIDHQSFEGDVPDVLESIWSEDEKEFKKNMTDFIFNSAYYVTIDNDNH